MILVDVGIEGLQFFVHTVAENGLAILFSTFLSLICNCVYSDIRIDALAHFKLHIFMHSHVHYNVSGTSPVG